MDDKERISKEVKDIIEGKGHYGTVKIDTQYLKKHFIWIGSNGLSSSVGQWIRVIEKTILHEHNYQILRGYRWFCDTNLSGIKQQMWYFGIEVDNPMEHCKQFIVCGGCTDFSGEGNRARELADFYLKSIVPESLIITCSLEHMLDRILD